MTFPGTIVPEQLPRTVYPSSRLREGQTEAGDFWGREMGHNLQRLTVTANPSFTADLDNTIGLKLGYRGGWSWTGAAWAHINDGAGAAALTLADNTVNYVERMGGGVPTVNQVGFSADRIPMCKVTTYQGEIVDILDARPVGDPTGAGTLPPSAHHATHENGGVDEINVTGLSGLLADPQTPLAHTHTRSDITDFAHAATHQHGGADELVLTGMTGLLATPQTPAPHALVSAFHTAVGLTVGHVLQATAAAAFAFAPLDWANIANKPATMPPGAHHLTHELGGSDKISVAGLSGLLADPQTPLAHALVSATHTASGLTAGNVLKALTATTFGFAALAATDIASGVVSLARGGTGADLSATGPGFLRQAGAGAAVTVSPLVAADLPTHDIITKHSAAGLTAGNVLKATGATTFAFALLDWTEVGGKPASFTPAAHHTTHELGGADKVNVAGLSGLLADPQTPLAHGLVGATHTVSGLTTGNVLKALSATTYGFAAVDWTELTSKPATFPPSPHDIITAHTAAGLSAGQVLKALTATTFGFAALTAGDLTGGNITWAQLPTGSGTWTANPTVSGTLTVTGLLTAQASITITGGWTATHGAMSATDAYLTVNGVDHVLAANDHGMYENVGNLNFAARGSMTFYLDSASAGTARSFTVYTKPQVDQASPFPFFNVTSDANLNLRFDANNRLNVAVNSTGGVTLDAIGTNPVLTLADTTMVVGSLGVRNVSYTWPVAAAAGVLTSTAGGVLSWAASATPGAHAASHQDGGADEINVTNLSGLLADPQTPLAHDIITKHTASGLTTGTFLKALSATTFGFVAHGLTYTDVGAAPAVHTHAAADVTSGVFPVARGGTGLSTIAAFALWYASATDTVTTLGPNTTATKKFLRMTGTGSAGAAPAWDTLVAGDLPVHDLITAHSASGLTTGTFLKATGATTFAFQAHGLTYTDVGAAPAVHTHSAADITSGLLATARGGTAADLSASGPGFLKQASVGSAVTVAALAVADIPTHDIITKHSAAGLTTGHVLQALSATTFGFAALAAGSLPTHTHSAADITSGLLALARGGTGADLSATGPGFLKQTGAGSVVSVATLAVADIPTHDIISKHSASGLTTGQFLKATSATTFAFAAHGLTYTDVGAAAASHTHSAADITSGVLSVTVGGTGLSNPAANALLVGAGASPLTTLAPGVAGQVVRSTGTTWASAALTATDLPAHTHSAADITSGTLAYARLPTGGGTWANGGDLTFTGGDIAIGSGAALKSSVDGVNNRIVMDASGNVDLYARGSMSFRVDNTNTQTTKVWSFIHDGGTTIAQLLETGQMALGAGTATNVALLIQTPVTASSARAYGILLRPGLTAAAANDVLSSLTLPSSTAVNDGGFANITYTGISYVSPTVTGTLASETVLYINPMTGSATAYAIQAVGAGLVRFNDRTAIGVAPPTDAYFQVYGTPATGFTGTTQSGIVADIIFTASATSLVRAMYAGVRTPAAAYTVSQTIGLQVPDVNKGAGSSITVQYGVYVASQTQGATNYAFYGNAGGARFGDPVSIGTGTPSASTALTIVAPMTAMTGTIQIGIDLGLTGTSAGTANVIGTRIQAASAAAAYTLGDLRGLSIQTPTIGAGSTVTTVYGIRINDQTGGGTNYALYTALGLVRFGGNVGIISPLTNAGLNVGGGTITSGVDQYGLAIGLTYGADATSSMRGLNITVVGAAGTYTTANVYGLTIGDMTLGSVQTVTAQYGIYINSQTKGGTNYALYTNAGLVRLGGALTLVSSSLTINGVTYTWPASVAAGVLQTTAGGVLSWVAAPAPAAHHTTHENGGADQISVAGLTGLLATAQTPAAHTHPASDITSGILSVGVGGTGLSNPSANALLVGAGASAMTTLAPGAAGQVVRSNGTSWASAALAAGDLPSHTHSAADVTSGTLAIARGGTGLATIAAFALYYASATDTLTTLAPNTLGSKRFLRMTGTGSAGQAPAWDTVVPGDIISGTKDRVAYYDASTGALTTMPISYSTSNFDVRILSNYYLYVEQGNLSSGYYAAYFKAGSIICTDSDIGTTWTALNTDNHLYLPHTTNAAGGDPTGNPRYGAGAFFAQNQVLWVWRSIATIGWYYNVYTRSAGLLQAVQVAAIVALPPLHQLVAEMPTGTVMGRDFTQDRIDMETVASWTVRIVRHMRELERLVDAIAQQPAVAAWLVSHPPEPA